MIKAKGKISSSTSTAQNENGVKRHGKKREELTDVEPGCSIDASPAAQAHRTSIGNVNGINRPMQNGQLDKTQSSLRLVPLKPTVPLLEEWVGKKPLHASIRSNSTGYYSFSGVHSRTQERNQIDRSPIYNGQRNRTNPDFSQKRVTSLPRFPSIETRHGRMSNPASTAKRQLIQRSPSSCIDDQSLLRNVAKEAASSKSPDRYRRDELKIRKTPGLRGDKLRQEIEDKLKQIRLRHEKAMRILRDHQRQYQVRFNTGGSIDRPNHHATGNCAQIGGRNIPKKYNWKHRSGGNASAVMEEARGDTRNQGATELDYVTLEECSPVNLAELESNDGGLKFLTDANLEDSPAIEKEIIKPLIDAVLRESVNELSSRETDENDDRPIPGGDVYADAEQFLYEVIIPGAIRVAASISS